MKREAGGCASSTNADNAHAQTPQELAEYPWLAEDQMRRGACVMRSSRFHGTCGAIASTSMPACSGTSAHTYVVNTGGLDVDMFQFGPSLGGGWPGGVGPGGGNRHALGALVLPLATPAGRVGDVGDAEPARVERPARGCCSSKPVDRVTPEAEDDHVWKGELCDLSSAASTCGG